MARRRGARTEGGLTPGSRAPEQLQFGRDVRPILAENCFACHGQQTRKAGLRLDTFEGATGVRKGRQAVVPGNLGASALVARILSTDEDERMPPPDSHRRLTTEQVALLRRWIDQGAAYEPHWAFMPPRRRPLPPMGTWARHPIGAFVLARLEAEGLTPARQAGPVAWLRRVSFDLTGLAPTIEDLDAFLADAGARGESAYGAGTLTRASPTACRCYAVTRTNPRPR